MVSLSNHSFTCLELGSQPFDRLGVTGLEKLTNISVHGELVEPFNMAAKYRAQ